ncbi:ABC transporter permease [Amycolatopsis sp. NPDC098790]|uniref:ABC transporter permease n=1 Tax=Amycolatopsis sp. NPDC098790 TaxID=3363939 RepID=UPI003815DD9C
MTMAGFILRRLLAMAVVLAVVSFLVFSLLNLAPGDPARILLGPVNPSPEALARIRAEFHLDDSWLTQYRIWLTNALHGDFGRSIRSGQPVAEVLGERLPVTVTLAVYSFLLTAAIAIPAGLVAGVRRGSKLDASVTLTTLIGVSAPPFAVSVLLIYVFAVGLGWFPTYGSGEEFADRLYHLTLPAVALATGQIALVARQVRAATMDVAERDFVKFARARGTRSSIVWRRYVLHNAALPVMTVSGLVFAYALTGAVLIESAFGLQGLGALLVDSVTAKDLPVVQALALLTALLVLVTNLVVDVSYHLLNPRLRKSGERR